jgi:flagellar biogenesis protein FliO
MGDSAAALIMFLLASLAVIALALLTTRGLSRWSAFQSRGRRLRVLEGVPVGRNRHLLLVAVGKEVLVVGSSEGGVTLVHTVPDPEALLGPDWEQAPPPQESPVPSAMAGVESAVRAHLEKMRSLLRRPGGGSHAE